MKVDKNLLKDEVPTPKIIVIVILVFVVLLSASWLFYHLHC